MASTRLAGASGDLVHSAPASGFRAATGAAGPSAGAPVRSHAETVIRLPLRGEHVPAITGALVEGATVRTVEVDRPVRQRLEALSAEAVGSGGIVRRRPGGGSGP
jgi:hypothetical protein